MKAQTDNNSAGHAARNWRAKLPGKWRRRSLLRGGALFAFSFLVYVAAMVGAVCLGNFWWRTVSLTIAPLMIGSLFIIGHDAAHNSLTPYSWLNRLLARIGLLPAWHPYSSWVHAHNTLHHGGTNLRGKHPDFVPLTKEEYGRLPAWRQFVERVFRSPVGPGLSYLFGFYFGYILFPSAKRRSSLQTFEWDRLLVGVFFLAQVLGVYLLARNVEGLFLPPLPYALLDVILPWTIWIQFMGFISYIQHTHPKLAWYDDPAEWSFYHAQLTSSTHVIFPFPVESMLNNIMDHTAHHIDPAIPLYYLPESQRQLEQEAHEHVTVVRWFPRQYLELCRICKLYDFDRQCWTDFNGNATSEMGLAKTALRELSLESGVLAH